MRPIKFRAWYDKRFREVYPDDKASFEHFTLLEAENYDLSLADDIMQFTGLKDRNGVEIYEGDLVKCIHHNPDIQEVRFIEGGFCTWHEDAKYPIDINHFYDSTGIHIEVIGNKFEGEKK